MKKWFTRSLVAKFALLTLVACNFVPMNTNLWKVYDPTEFPTSKAHILVVAPTGPAEASSDQNPFVAYYVVAKAISLSTGRLSLVVAPIEKYYALDLRDYAVETKYFMVYPTGIEPNSVVTPIELDAREVMTTLCQDTAGQLEATALCY